MNFVFRLSNSPLQGVTFCRNPLIWSGLAGAAASGIANLVGAGLGAASQNSNTDKAIAAQREENALAYQRNIEQWQRENDYNSPVNQIARLRAAGLNPNLAYGTPNISSPSPQMAAADMSGIASKRSVVGAMAEQALNTRYMNAMIENINAQTHKTEEETKKTGAEYEAQMTYNQYQNDILTGNLQEQKARIELNASQTDLNDMKSREAYTNIQNIMASTNKLKADVDKIGAEVENINEDTAIKRIEKAFREPVLKAQMSHLYAQSKLAGVTAAKTQEEFNQLSASAIYNLAMKKEGANNAFLQGIVLQNTGTEIQCKIDAETFKNRKMRENEWLDDVSKVAGTFSDVVGSVTDAFTFGYRQKYVWK